MRGHGYECPQLELVEGKWEPVNKPWTQTRHIKHNLKDEYGTWDPEELSVADFAVQCEYNLGKKRGGGIVDNVPMASLGNGVKNFPSVSTGDGLHLTRCVQYAMAHPNLDLMFPRDFKSVTESLPPVTRGPQHSDAATFARFRNGNTSTPPGPAAPVAAQMPVPQSSRRAASSRPRNSAPVQSKVGKAYKTSKEQDKDARTARNKRTQLDSLTPSHKLLLESMSNVFSAQPGDGASVSSTPSSAAPILTAGAQQPETQASSTPSLASQTPPRDIHEVVGGLDLTLPDDWDMHLDVYNPRNFPDFVDINPAPIIPADYGSPSAGANPSAPLYNNHYAAQNGPAFVPHLEVGSALDFLFSVPRSQTHGPRLPNGYTPGAPLDSSMAPAFEPLAYIAPVARMY